MRGKLTIALLIIVVLVFICAGAEATGLPEGPYKNSCKYCDVKGNILSCRCYTSRSFYTVSSIDITKCRQGSIQSNKGTLVCTQTGQKSDQIQEPVDSERHIYRSNEG